MRILYVAPNIPVPGTHGGSTHVTEVVRALSEEHEVCLLARQGSHGDRVYGIGLGTATGAAGYALAALHLPAAYLIAKSFKPDAIYERFSAHGLGVILGKLLDVPVISMVLDPTINRLTLEGADKLITTAPQLVDERYHHKLEEVSWGANTDLFCPRGEDDPARGEIRARYGISPSTFVFGYTGAFYPWHGLEELVDAMALLYERGQAQGMHLLLVGDGKLKEQIEARIASLGPDVPITMVGRVPYVEVPDYIAACEVCVAPYNPARHPELNAHGMYFDPLKVFEYLACAKPTITLDSENLRRLFNHKEHAYLVAPGDVEALAASMLEVAAMEDRGAAMGEAGRRLVEERFSWRSHGRHLTRMFKGLIDARRR